MAMIDDRGVSTPSVFHSVLCGAACVSGLVLLTVGMQWLMSMVSF